MLEYDRIDILEGIDINKTNASKECDICSYWCFLDKGFMNEPYLSSGCHNLMQKAINFNDAAIVFVGEVIIEFVLGIGAKMMQ